MNDTKIEREIQAKGLTAPRAVRKVWPLMGYALKEQLAQSGAAA